MVKSYLYQFSINFDQTIIAIIKLMAFRVLFVIVTFYDLDIDQIDIKTTFVYGLINQLIYIEIPKNIETDVNKNMVCKVLKALHNLEQLPRLWYKQISSFFLERYGL